MFTVQTKYCGGREGGKKGRDKGRGGEENREIGKNVTLEGIGITNK